MQKKEIRFIDMFAGIGGFRRGLECADSESYREQQGNPEAGKGGSGVITESQESVQSEVRGNHPDSGATETPDNTAEPTGEGIHKGHVGEPPCEHGKQPVAEGDGKGTNNETPIRETPTGFSSRPKGDNRSVGSGNARIGSTPNEDIPSGNTENSTNGEGGTAQQGAYNGISGGQGQSEHDNKGRMRNDTKQSDVGQATFRCVGTYEIDKHAVSVYNRRFGERISPIDIRQLKATDIPDFDLLCAGFPCQSFSIAGKRKGFKDTRGTLFFEICKILGHKRPEMVFLENVKGLLSKGIDLRTGIFKANEGEPVGELTDDTKRVKDEPKRGWEEITIHVCQGWVMFRIIESLAELGYVGSAEVLNSKNFGVPQNRERIFIIGHLGKGGRSKVFPLGEDGGSFNEHKSVGKGVESSKRLSQARFRCESCGLDFFNADVNAGINQAIKGLSAIWGEMGPTGSARNSRGGRNG